MGRTSSGRIDQLDGLRAVAITLVFLAHAFAIPMLWAGVDLFFVLSGFLITGILIGQKNLSLSSFFRTFYSRRMRRIWPPYLLLLVVSALVFGVWWLRSWYFYVFLMNLLDPLHVPFLDTLHVLWTLAVEEQFYIVWPFVIFFLSQRAIFRVAVGLIVAAPILRCYVLPVLMWSSGPVTAFPFRTALPEDHISSGCL